MKMFKALLLSVREQATYLVDIELVDQGRKQYMQYTCELKRDTSGYKYNRIEIKRSAQKIEPQVNDSFFEMLAHTTSLWNKLILDIDNYGNIIKLVNLKEIQDYWEKDLGFRLKHEYEGELAEKVITSLERTLYSEEVFLDRIRQDLFFQTWLKPLYNDYYYASQTERLNAKEWMPLSKGDYIVKDWVFNGVLTQDNFLDIEGKVMLSEEQIRKYKDSQALTQEAVVQWNELTKFRFTANKALCKAVWKQEITHQGDVLQYKRVIIEKR